VLILGVVVLAWMAWQLSRQLNASPSSLKSEADAIDRPA
jgi:threonine/homoserine/homoserine lactone efflux protein